jgi:hypothetical protein
MIPSRLGELRTNRVLWALVLFPILVWVIHLTFDSAMVHLTCSDPGLRWTLYAGTVLPAVVVGGTIALALVLVRQEPGADPDGSSLEDQVAFVAYLALAIGILNLLLIIAEGILIPFVSSCA